LDDLGGSGVTLRAIARYLEARGHTVLPTCESRTLDEMRAWSPHLILGQQWATDEASYWATALHVPFVMLVHGPGQYEQFMPQCDLVIFNTYLQLELARAALGSTPATVLYPPVFRADYETAGAGDCLTLIGSDPHKGLERFLSLARAMPEEKFLLVTEAEIAERPANLLVQNKVSDVRGIYARTKLLLMPSQQESYGRVAVEAAMSGIPTVASDLPGIREATANHATLVGPHDDWEKMLRATLSNLEACREKARGLADLRDPAAELDALHARLVQLAQAGRRRPTLSLCMTVANEAPTLERAVQSVARFVDRIIIGVDVKSADATASIAKRLATDYFEYTEDSPPNFPRMRNRAMERVATDWAIVLDGHEWIEHAELIGPAIETTAWSIEIQTLFEPDENRVPGLSFPFPRIHRRHVRFVGAPAHEEVSAPCERRDSRLGIKVWHERKPGRAAIARSQEKAGRELDHLRAAWEENGDRRALFYLANGLREAGRLTEAITAYEQYLQAPNFAEEGWQALLYAARCHVQLEEWEAARGLFEQAIMQRPERAEASVGLAYLLLDRGETLAAAAWFRMAASLPEPEHCRLFVEVPVYRWGAWHGLALALDQLGDDAGAIEAESRAGAGGAGSWAMQNINLWLSRTAAGRDAQNSPARVGSNT
jgi:tetratricopeptide (TPR) repeat protein